MKTFPLLFLLSLTLSLAAHAQTRNDAEATYGLAGPVRNFRIETALVVVKDGQSVEGPRVLQMTAEFDEAGNRTDFGMYDDKGVLVRRIVSKFDGPRMIEFVNYDGAGQAWLKGTQSYDKQGRLIEEATYNGDNSFRSKKVYRRNERGQAVEWAEYSANEVVLDRMTNTFTADGGLKTSEREMRSPNGSLVSRHIHDIPAKRVEIISYKPDGSVLSKSVRVNQEVNEYGGDGSLRRTTSLSNQRGLRDAVVVNADGSRQREAETPD